MGERMERKMLRKQFSAQGWALLVYYLIMNVCVSAAVLAESLYDAIRAVMKYGIAGLDQIYDSLIESILGNGWGYFLAVGIGFAILLAWKGKKFTFGLIWTQGRPMTAGSLASLLCVFVSGQLVFQLVAVLLESIFNLFGLSVMGAIDSASMAGMDTPSMFLYAGIMAPIAEEILFRGLILRSLMPCGKKFAILTSAILFGVFHGNLVQSPFAFVLGLILGYAAAEYSILWAMVLHMFNNMFISDTLGRLFSLLPGNLGDTVFWVVILGLSIAGLVILLVRRKEVGEYLRAERIPGRYMACFFTSAGVITLLIIMFLNSLLSVSQL